MPIDIGKHSMPSNDINTKYVLINEIRKKSNSFQ